jgi:hypothetical protein
VTVAVAEARYLAAGSYNPRHDPDFPDILIGDLLRHFGEWRQLGQIYAADVWAVRDVVEIGRRLGLVIEGDRQRGYRLVGFQRRRYVHVRKASAWPPGFAAAPAARMTILDELGVKGGR